MSRSIWAIRTITRWRGFLASGAPGVGAITLHATGAKHQHGAADAARDAGISVLYDPRTERLAYDDPSGATQKLPGWTGQVADIGRLSSSIDDRARLVDAVIAGHPNEVTIVTPPSFYVTDERTSLLNVHLAEATRLATALPVRARVTLSSRMPLDLVADLGREYRAAGITSVDLRVSPLNGEKDGIRKISKVFKTADAFRASGIEVSLGNSGNVGQVAYALGHAESFSVGIGENERVDHAGRMSRQVAPPPPKYDENGRKVGGVVAGKASISLDSPRPSGGRWARRCWRIPIFARVLGVASGLAGCRLLVRCLISEGTTSMHGHRKYLH